jgi:hypothetical protein
MYAHVLGDPARHAGLDVAVDVGVGAGVLEPERDVVVPACTNVLERVVAVAAGTAGPQELLKPWLTTASSSACLLPKWW